MAAITQVAAGSAVNIQFPFLMYSTSPKWMMTELYKNIASNTLFAIFAM